MNGWTTGTTKIRQRTMNGSSRGDFFEPNEITNVYSTLAKKSCTIKQVYDQLYTLATGFSHKKDKPFHQKHKREGYTQGPQTSIILARATRREWL